MSTHNPHTAAEAEAATHMEDLGPSLFNKLRDRANA